MHTVEPLVTVPSANEIAITT